MSDFLESPLHTPARYIPRLEQLCHELRRQGAEQLADDLELNYVYGTLGQVYNQATNTDVALEANVVTYDFKDVPESHRTLIYTLVLGRIQRIVWRHKLVRIQEFATSSKSLPAGIGYRPETERIAERSPLKIEHQLPCMTCREQSEKDEP